MNSWRLKLLYDGECPICRREMEWLKRRDRVGNLATENIAALGFDPAKYELTWEEVTRVIHGVNRILLTGDLNEPSMEDVLHELSATVAEPGPLTADVYKAAHHGSQHFLLDFLKVLSPNAAVISSGDAKNDEYGHPRAVLMGTITRYSKHPRPAVFCTELAACYSKLSREERQEFRAGTKELYARALKGIVHLRSDGEHLCLATVHGRKPPSGDQLAQTTWKWDVWPSVE